MQLAREFLTKLFIKAENDISKGNTGETSLRLTPAKCPGYFAMRSLDDARNFRVTLTLAERKGAIRIEPSEHAYPRDVHAISVQSLEILAAYLDLPVRSSMAAAAAVRLEPFAGEFPILSVILERWKQGKKVRGDEATVASVVDLTDAISVIRCRRDVVEEEMIRRVSIKLFNNSKRIEGLAKWLDVLLSNDLSPSGLESRDIYSLLGLQKAPPLFLIAGTVVVVSGESRAPGLRPYSGYPPTAIARFEFAAAPTTILTIENLQTFYEFALAATKRSDVTVVYTGGMPSPAWRAAFSKILVAAPRMSRVYHFGDLDVGGLRISKVIARTAAEVGFRLLPWLMTPQEFLSSGARTRQASNSQVDEMGALCRDIGWEEIASQVEATRLLAEQEALTPAFP